MPVSSLNKLSSARILLWLVHLFHIRMAYRPPFKANITGNYFPSTFSSRVAAQTQTAHDCCLGQSSRTSALYSGTDVSHPIFSLKKLLKLLAVSGSP